MSNIYGEFFAQFGGLDSPDLTTWRLVDLIESHFPEAVERLKRAGNDQEGRRIMIDELFPLIDASPDLDDTQKDDACHLLENLAEANLPDPRETREVG
jgi:hypothetical protein